MALHTYSADIHAISHRLSGHGYWLRGGEWNTLPTSEFEARPLKVLIARLSTYLDTSESFTHTLLYQALASLPEVYPDMAYLPPPRDGALMAKANIPWLVGTQSKADPRDFHVIALSNAIVQELVNLPTLLQRSGLWLPRAERLARKDFPLLILGGANVFHASVLDHAESPIDGLFIGENLADIQELFQICERGRQQGWEKSQLLQELEAIPGFAQPGSGKPTRKRNTETLDIRRLPAPRPVLYKFSGLGQEPVALSRGCPAFCSFCAESFDLKPYRENPQDTVVQNALQLKRSMGLEGVDLFSFNFNFYEDLYPLLEKLGGQFSSIGLKSQRFDMIAQDPGMLGYLRAVGKSSFTFGMEGVSARLRRYLQKGLEEGDLWKALGAVFRHQVRELKVFMIATGIEEEEDFQEFAEFLRRLPDVMRVCEAPPKLTFSATPLVRFPWTPLEFAPSPTPEAYASITRRLGHIVEKAGFFWREAAEEAENYVSQVLVRADVPEYWEALQAAIAETDFLYYRSMDHRFMVSLRRQLEERGLPDAKTLAGGDLASHANKPWARHDTGVRRNFLWLQYKRAARHEDKGYCLGTTQKEGTCLACDSCETEEDTQGLVHQRTKHPNNAQGFQESLRGYRKNAVAIGFNVDWGEKVLGLPRKYVGLVLASAMMRAAPELTEGFWRYRTSWAPEGDHGCAVCGEDILFLEWQRESAAKLELLLTDSLFLAEVNSQLGEWGRLVSKVEMLPEEAEAKVPEAFEIDSPFEPQFQTFAQSRSMAFTQIRKGEGWEAVFGKDALKKKWLKGLSWRPLENNQWRIRVIPLAKFQPEAFLREGFKLPDPDAWVKLKLRALGFASSLKIQQPT